ncbi:hypothetical protein CDAR_4921 [Caerostris darwini]|uniref:Uncharacterized protein n=1 Tax=Caerostris darwini TaxID=1538125 RepID=A0AAV4P9E8_9ARAC|nr:hypothetical protein CDAR_4921 [Caerostris darwini]
MQGLHSTKRAERRDIVDLSIASGATFPQDTVPMATESFIPIVWWGHSAVGGRLEELIRCSPPSEVTSPGKSNLKLCKGFHSAKRAVRRETVNSIASEATFPQDSCSHGNGVGVPLFSSFGGGIPKKGVGVGAGRTNKVLSAIGGHV